jgi:D-alanyl-lipoteichoic acid acyltransferase DltB (MBOAT superfamily)
MLIGGLWHGAAIRFILWGAIHGVALAIHKWMTSLFGLKTSAGDMSIGERIINTLITFHLVCFAWIFFRADTMEKAGQMLSQIFTQFEAGVFTQLVSGYCTVFILMAAGYIMHFIPKDIDLKIRQQVTILPFWGKAFLLSLAIFIVIQMKSSEIVPFIYFQF